MNIECPDRPSPYALDFFIKLLVSKAQPGLGFITLTQGLLIYERTILPGSRKSFTRVKINLTHLD